MALSCCDFGSDVSLTITYLMTSMMPMSPPAVRPLSVRGRGSCFIIPSGLDNLLLFACRHSVRLMLGRTRATLDGSMEGAHSAAFLAADPTSVACRLDPCRPLEMAFMMMRAILLCLSVMASCTALHALTAWWPPS